VVAVAFFGDGAVEEGVFHESLNFAALKKLPIVFYCENNFFAVHSSIYKTQANFNIYQWAKIYKMPGWQIDGNNILEVYQTAKRAVHLARSGKGPVLIEARTYRWCQHVGPHLVEKSQYDDRQGFLKWKRRCPIKNFENYLISRGLLNAKEIIEIKNNIDKKIRNAWNKMKNSSTPKLKILLS
jgi:pyruvate dehydrogenase E1 component alpha subunit